MSPVQRFAQVIGAVYVPVGVMGFVPPLLLGSLPPGVLGPLAGLRPGVFVVDWFRSLTHLLTGAAGLAVHRSFAGSKACALALGVAYLGLFLLGVFSGGIATLGDLLPLNAADNVLHLVTAFAACLTARLPGPERRAVDRRA